MKLGVALPFIDVAVGGDPAAIREFAQTAEEIGYQDLAAPDHVLGVNVASRPDWGDRNTSADLFHDPFVLFGFLAGCTRNIEFSTQVLILAQRQAVLVAKQAASLDVLCGGRFRLGVGSAGPPSSSSGSTRISATAAAAPRSRSRSCRRCGRSRTSPSPASTTR